MSAGWGKPLNKPSPVHWWRDDHSQACNPGGMAQYGGPKVDVSEVSLDEVCPACFNIVTNARAVLGTELVADLAAAATRALTEGATRCLT